MSFGHVRLETWNSIESGRFRIEEGVAQVSFPNMLNNVNVELIGDGVLRLNPEMAFFVGHFSDTALTNGSVQLNGGVLSIGSIGNSAVTKPLQGMGTLDAVSATEVVLCTKPVEPITLRARDGLLTITNTVTVDPDSALSIMGSGIISLQGDQQVRHIMNHVDTIGPRGAITIAEGKTLTLADGNAVETFRSSLQGKGRFVKESANCFQYDGGSAPEGGIEIREGTMRLSLQSEGGGNVTRLRFDQESSLLTDDSGRLTLRTNGATWEEDPERGGVLRLDGTQSLYQQNVPAKSVLWGDTDYTVSFWFKTPVASSRPNARIFWYGDNWGESRDIQIGFNGSYDKMLVAHFANDFTGISTGKALNDDQWHHFTVSRNRSKITLYLDGENIYENITMKPLRLPPNSCFAIGSYQGLDEGRAGDRYDGWVDDVIVLPYSVEAQQIAALGAGTVPEKIPGMSELPKPVIHYSFDDATDIGKDSAGVGNDLVMPLRISGYQFPFASAETLGESSADPFSFSIVDAECVEDTERGMVAYFDGSVEGLHQETTPLGAFVTGCRDFTVALWAKIPVGVEKGAFFHYGYGEDSQNLLFGVSRKKLFFSAFGKYGDFMDKGSDVCDGKWHHFVCVQKNRQYSLWCDGKIITTFTMGVETKWADGETFDIGSYDCKDGWGFTGWMDDLVALNYALADTTSPQGLTVDAHAGSWILGRVLERGLPDLRWHHYVVTGSKAMGYILFVDGTPTQKTPICTGYEPRVTMANFRLGMRSTGECFEGAIDEFKVFDRLLSKEEISRLIQSETKRFGNFGAAPITVLSNATLEVPYVSRKVGTLSGEGNVVVTEGVLQQTGTGTFDGTVLGNGTIGAASGGSLTISKGLASFTGTVMVEENSTVSFGNEATSAKVLLQGAGVVEGTIAADVIVPDGACFSLTQANAAKCPFVQTAGSVLVQGGGTVQCEEGLLGRFVLATGSEVNAVALDQWTVVAKGNPQAVSAFRIDDGIFSVSVSMPGTLLFLR